MTKPARWSSASASLNRHAVRPITRPTLAPTSSSGASAGTVTASPGPASVLRGLMYRTTDRGGALYGASWTDAPSASSAARSLSSVPYTLPEKRYGAASNGTADRGIEQTADAASRETRGCGYCSEGNGETPNS